MSDSVFQSIFCARCSQVLHPGRGELFVVQIDARADPYPPDIPDEEDPEEIRKKIEKLLKSLEGESESSLRNQVHQRLVLHLCVPCYKTWIEDPAK